MADEKIENHKKEVMKNLSWEKIYGDVQNTIEGNNGWTNGKCPLHRDGKENVRSFGFRKENLTWNCFKECGEGNVFSFIMKEKEMDFKEAAEYLRHLSGVPPLQFEPKQPPISEQAIESYVKSMSVEVRNFLMESKGLTEETINKYQLGWNSKFGRITVPMRDEKGLCRNIKQYKMNPTGKQQKDFFYKKGLPIIMMGLPEVKHFPGNEIILCEGQWDMLLLRQEGFNAVSCPTGAGTFKPFWANVFKGKDVIIIYDCDSAGINGAIKAVIPRLKGIAKSIKNVSLGLAGTREENDVSDFFLKKGGSCVDLRALIEATPFYVEVKEKGERAIKLSSFTEIEKNKYIDKKVTVNIMVCAETSGVYHAVRAFRVLSCKKRTKGTCCLCPTNEDIIIPYGAEEYIGTCNNNIDKVIHYIRRYVCQEQERPTIKITEKTTVKVFFCHQEIDRASENQTLVEKEVYYLDYETIEPGLYTAIGWVKTNPNTFEVTFLIKEMKRMGETFQAFDLEKALPLLRKYKELSTLDVLKDIGANVTKIYEREDLLLSLLLTYCSPLRFQFNKRLIRGWLIVAVIGDGGTGKTITYEEFIKWVEVGEFASGLTSSRAGLLYGLVLNPKKGWVIEIGRIPMNHRKLLVIDEAHMLRGEKKEHPLREMSMALEGGRLVVDRVKSIGWPSETRVFLVSNPKDDRTMDYETHPCMALGGVYSPPIIRRFDLGVFLSLRDIKDKEKLNQMVVETKPMVTSEMMRSVIFWVWNLESEQIIYSKEATKLTLELSKQLGKIFDNSRIPLIQPDDARNNLARIATAFAALQLSSDDKFLKLYVHEKHVKYAYNFIHSMYIQDNCALDIVAAQERLKTELTDYDRLETVFLKKIKSKASFRPASDKIYDCYFLTCIREFESDKIVKRKTLTEFVGCDESTIGRYLNVLKRLNLIEKKEGGYEKNPRFTLFLRKFAKKFPEYFTRDAPSDIEF